jgi:hypothetical protein
MLNPQAEEALELEAELKAQLEDQRTALAEVDGR